MTASRRRHAAIVAAPVLLASVLELSCAETRGPATADERAKAVALARALEQDPLAANAPRAREWLRQWIIEVPDIQFEECAELLGHALGHDYPYSREVGGQVLFSGAAFATTHPNQQRDRVAVFHAGVEGALRAYETLLRSRPDARSAFLDDLLAKRDRGALADHVAGLVRAKCKKLRLEVIAHLVGAGVALVLGALVSLRLRRDETRRVDGEARRARILSRVVFFCSAYYVTAAVVLQVLKPEFDPRFRFMSEYVFGPYGWLMSTTFFVLALGVLAAVAGLRSAQRWPPSGRLGLGLLTVAAVCFALAGIFRVGMPHLAAGAVALPGIVMATLLLSWSLRQAAARRAIRNIALLLSLGMFAALEPMVAGVGPPGIEQRTLLFLFLVWLCLMAHRRTHAG